MPRKAFLADVTAAANKLSPNIIDVKRGDDDGDIDFIYISPACPPVSIGLIALDVPGYPHENTYMVCTKSSDVPEGVSGALESIANFSTGMTVSEIITAIADRLQKLLVSGSVLDPITFSDSDVEMQDDFATPEENEEAESDDDYEYPDHDDDDHSFDGDAFGDSSSKKSAGTYNISRDAAAILNTRIRRDLKTAKLAGFKIGILSGLKADSITSMVSISIQAAKLGLSEEALQAWDLEPKQYVVLLMRYAAGYKTFEAVIAEPAHSLDITFRVGVSNKYKPTMTQAHAAFSDATKTPTSPELIATAATDHEKQAGFQSMFISSSLNEFINTQFISLTKIRSGVGLGWDGAKHFYNDKNGKIGLNASEADALPDKYFVESSPKQDSLPPMMTGDHIHEGVTQPSFPLIAAQFAMRYLVRCTEYCLVCHNHIDEGFGALKPYVCSNPLCLYQYMSLGFGPSVEHEILTQPYVVDLLISFCYVAVYCQRIREYPDGMSLSVPPVLAQCTTSFATGLRGSAPEVPIQGSGRTEASKVTISVLFDAAKSEIIFNSSSTDGNPLKKGDWIMLSSSDADVYTHHRVEDVAYYPTVQLAESSIFTGRSNDFYAKNGMGHTTSKPPTPPPGAPVQANLVIYNQNFDLMTKQEKADTIVTLLRTLPTVKELRSYLSNNSRFHQPSLRAWHSRVSPAALGLLRWIIASNRSCIVQVDKCPGQDESNMAGVRLDQKCGNVADGWIQFRFAQGSPDKEQRFLQALKTQKAALTPKYPTIFAFHGSPLQNWHSIIRHGLNFAETLHGRAYGNGVYHAMDQNTSTGYAGGGHGTHQWPGSELKVSSAMSLNEIVNSPDQFASKNPYLVVQHVDWIQCRYLLVQAAGENHYQNSVRKTSEIAINEVEQDPKFTARTTLNTAISIPKCAINVSRTFRVDGKSPPQPVAKRQKKSSFSKLDMSTMGVVSDDDELEDMTFFLSEDEWLESSLRNPVKEKSRWSLFKKENTKPTTTVTDFVPGSLNQKELPMMKEPQYATPSATMRLNKELKAVLKVQASTPPQELGWYINQDMICNVYQWIVELHSFELSLPLAKDMRAAGITSIVLEIRFGKDFPHSPPFVRVVRPRFLPFMQGGGGHVTAGGAMCMELLTNTGWSAVSSIEGVLLQVRMAIMNLEPKPARLWNAGGNVKQMDSGLQNYGVREAIEAYKRACMTHGWKIPKDFNDFAIEAPDESI